MARNYKLAIKIEERNQLASEAEKNANLKQAVNLYEQNIKENYASEYAFQRLMTIYRKRREYKKELQVINRGIDLFKHQIEENTRHSISRRADSKKLERLSAAIIKKSGLRKNEMHFPDPIDKWLKRKEIVKQKLTG
jgi:lipopolysaccharide biosynthesis regulator YciM